MALQHDQMVNKAMPFPKSYKIIVAFLARSILIICSNFIRILNLFYWAKSCSLCSPSLSNYYFKLPLNSHCASATLICCITKGFPSCDPGLGSHRWSKHQSAHWFYWNKTPLCLPCCVSHMVALLPSSPQHWWPTMQGSWIAASR